MQMQVTIVPMNFSECQEAMLTEAVVQALTPYPSIVSVKVLTAARIPPELEYECTVWRLCCYNEAGIEALPGQCVYYLSQDTDGVFTVHRLPISSGRHSAYALA